MHAFGRLPDRETGTASRDTCQSDVCLNVQARRDRYMSLASKMRVDQMLEQIHIDAKFDFDYVAFLCATLTVKADSLELSCTVFAV